MQLTSEEILWLRIILEYIFREHDNRRGFLELVGPERYEMTRHLWYSVNGVTYDGPHR